MPDKHLEMVKMGKSQLCPVKQFLSTYQEQQQSGITAQALL